MHNHRDLHRASLLTAVVVAAAVFATAGPGGQLTHVYMRLARSDAVYFFGPELCLITFATMFVVETFLRRWEKAWHFGARDWLMCAAALAIALAMVLGEQHFAAKDRLNGVSDIAISRVPSGAGLRSAVSSIAEAPWPFRLPGVFGLGCVAYALIRAVGHGSVALARPITKGANRPAMPAYISRPGEVGLRLKKRKRRKRWAWLRELFFPSVPSATGFAHRYGSSLIWVSLLTAPLIIALILLALAIFC
jgi:hypothetical protein